MHTHKLHAELLVFIVDIEKSIRLICFLCDVLLNTRFNLGNLHFGNRLIAPVVFSFLLFAVCRVARAYANGNGDE